MLLLADSGSTKTDWALRTDNETLRTLRTSGLNPFMLNADELTAALQRELLPQLSDTEVANVETIRFYGAGCRDHGTERMTAALATQFRSASIEVASDMLCAARALFGVGEGIACILGTGSNSCLYDGRRIVRNVSPLGFILGDEGSGAVLGRRLVGDVLKEQLSAAVREAFHATYPEVATEVVERVYRQPFPNRYLAHFVPFLKQHEDEPHVQQLILDEFSRFFRRNVSLYGRRDLQVSFVGSIAHYFSSQLRQAAASGGFSVGTILQAPFSAIERL